MEEDTVCIEITRNATESRLRCKWKVEKYRETKINKQQLTRRNILMTIFAAKEVSTKLKMWIIFELIFLQRFHRDVSEQFGAKMKSLTDNVLSTFIEPRVSEYIDFYIFAQTLKHTNLRFIFKPPSGYPTGWRREH